MTTWNVGNVGNKTKFDSDDLLRPQQGFCLYSALARRQTMGELFALQPTFTQGLILGQLSILLLLALVLKYLFLVTDSSPTYHLPTVAAASRSTLSTTHKLYEGKAESTDWLNVILAKVYLSRVVRMLSKNQILDC